MCLSCGYYNGKQVMDLEKESAKRAARIQAKKERIKVETGSATGEQHVTSETVAENTAVKEVGGKHGRKPDKQRESKG